MVAISEAMTTALQAYRSGNLVQAEWLCQQILEQRPHYVPALHLLGAIALQTGRLQSAIAHYQTVITLDPTHAEAHGNLAVALQSYGDWDEAAKHFQRSLALKPTHAPTHFNAGNLALRQKRYEQAIAHYEQAIALNPTYARAHNNLGNALREQGRLEDAIGQYRQAIALEPTDAQAHSNLGNALQAYAQRLIDTAFDHYQTSLKLQPSHPDGYFNLANAMRDLNQWQLATNHYRQALWLSPTWAEAHNNLALVLQELNEWERAIFHLRQAIGFQPEFAEAHSNLGKALYQQNDLEGAIAHLERAIALDPTDARAHFNLSFALLAAGDFKRGFVEFEWRWQCLELNPPTLPGNQWNGSSLQGQTILLATEQGLGDSIQFIRYASLVAQQASRVVVMCPATLLNLFSTIPGIDQLILDDTPLSQFDAQFDVYCPLMSLPRLFETTLETLPYQVPYLRPQASELRLPECAKFKVGLVWASEALKNPKLLKSYQNRTAPLSTFMAHLSHPDVALYSLQVGLHAADIDQLGFQDCLHDLSSQLRDFVDTAAAIDQLDLVISVDTAVAHLAGALAKPVWVVLPFAGDWRWMLHREDSPWYPTMRLFRQEAPGDWAGVMTKVSQALNEMAVAPEPS